MHHVDVAAHPTPGGNHVATTNTTPPLLRVGGLTVLAWGSPVVDAAGFHTADAIYPVGFKARRIWWGPQPSSSRVPEGLGSTSDDARSYLLSRVSYTCEVLAAYGDITGPSLEGRPGDRLPRGRPEFLISCDADPSLRVSGATPAEAFWRLRVAVLERCGASAHHLLSREEHAYLAERSSASSSMALASGPTNLGGCFRAGALPGLNAAVASRLRWAYLELPAGRTRVAGDLSHGAVQPAQVERPVPLPLAASTAPTIPPPPVSLSMSDAYGLDAGVWFGLTVPVIQAVLESHPDAPMLQCTPPDTNHFWPRYRFCYNRPTAAAFEAARSRRAEAADAEEDDPAPDVPVPSALIDIPTEPLHGPSSRLIPFNRLERNTKQKRRAVLAFGEQRLSDPDLADADAAAMGDVLTSTFAPDPPVWFVEDDAAVLRETEGPTNVPKVFVANKEQQAVAPKGQRQPAPKGPAPMADISTDAPFPATATVSPASAEPDPKASLAVAYRAWKAIGTPACERLVVRRSPIHGWGLFLKVDVPKNAMVVEYTGQLVREPVADRREIWYEERHRLLQSAEQARSAMRPHAAYASCSAASVSAMSPDPGEADALSMFNAPAAGRHSDGSGSCYLFRLDEEHIVDATLKGSAARFMNHCCEPNCYSDIINVDGEKKIVIFALRDLKRGEEVTYNYKFAIETDPSLKVPCYCGAKNCPGSMN